MEVYSTISNNAHTVRVVAAFTVVPITYLGKCLRHVILKFYVPCRLGAWLFRGDSSQKYLFRIYLTIQRYISVFARTSWKSAMLYGLCITNPG